MTTDKATIKHAEAEVLLPDLASGSLGDRESREVTAHVERCDECQEWLETYRLLESSLGPSREHPSADELARHATDQGGVDAALVDHLAHCADCRRSVELSTAAVAHGRGAPGRSTVPIRRREVRVSRYLAIAAAIVLAAVLLLFIETPPEEPALPADIVMTPPGDIVMSGQVLEAEEVIGAGNSMNIAKTEIASGADIVLRAGDVVSFGDGFSVGADANLVIAINSAASRSGVANPG